jgi:hypothetical protein
VLRVPQSPVQVSVAPKSPAIRLGGTDRVLVTVRNRSQQPIKLGGVEIELPFKALVLVPNSGRWFTGGPVAPLPSVFPNLLEWPPGGNRAPSVVLGGQASTLSFDLRGTVAGQFVVRALVGGAFFTPAAATGEISEFTSRLPVRKPPPSPAVVSVSLSSPSVLVGGTDRVAVTIRNRSEKGIALTGVEATLPYKALVLVKGSGRWLPGGQTSPLKDTVYPTILEWPAPGNRGLLKLAPHSVATLYFVVQGGVAGRYRLDIRAGGMFSSPDPVQVEITVVKRLARPSGSTLALDCPSGTAVGQTASIVGRLSPALAEARVEMSVAGPASVSPAQVTTSATGSFEWSFTPPAAGTWTISAKWPGDTLHRGSSTACTLAVGVIGSTLALACPQSANVGQKVTVQAQLTPPIASASIDLTASGPGPTVTATVQTGAGGKATLGLTFGQAGQWTVDGHWNGDPNHAASSGSCTVAVGALGQSSLSMNCPETASTSEELTMTAALTPAMQEASVTWTATAPDGSTQSQTVQTDATATAYYNVTVGQAGTWSFTAHWAGDANHAGTTGGCTTSVLTPSTLTLSCPTNPLQPESPATVSGTLTPAIARSAISIKYTPPAGSGQNPTTDQVTTDGTGYFADSFAENASGTWTLTASFRGDSTRAPSNANCTFTVLSP